MRILMCNYEYPPIGGGGGVLMEALAEELARRHAVTVLTSRAGDLPPAETVNGVELLRVPVFFRSGRQTANLPSMLAYVPAAIARGRSLGRRGFDVVNSHFVVPSAPAGAWLSGRWRVPHVVSIHGGDVYDPSKRLSPHRHGIFRAAIRRLARGADAVVANSSDIGANLRRYYTPEIEPLRIPLGIRRPELPARDRGALDLPGEAFVVVTIGRLVARKAVDRLLRVFSDAAIPGSRLVVIGDGPERKGLEAEAAELGVADQVRFTGQAGDAEKYAYLAAADAYASTSLHEGFGLVFLEAGAAGLPVFCYDRGGQTDFLGDGQTGFVMPVGDEAAMTRRLRELAASPERARELGEGARQAAEAHMIDRCAARYEALFERLIADRGGSAAGSGS